MLWGSIPGQEHDSECCCFDVEGRDVEVPDPHYFCTMIDLRGPFYLGGDSQLLCSPRFARFRGNESVYAFEVRCMVSYSFTI